LGPLNVAGKLKQLKILNPISYYILNTLNNVSTSYQASVLYDLLIEDLENLNNHTTFKKYFKEEVLLGNIYKELEHNGKIGHN